MLAIIASANKFLHSNPHLGSAFRRTKIETLQEIAIFLGPDLMFSLSERYCGGKLHKSIGVILSNYQKGAYL